MHRYKATIEYDGSPFVGWQIQKNGLSIQEVIQNAIFNLSHEKVIITGAGRTDSGVHAFEQIAHFDLKKKIKKKNFLPGLNQYIGNKPIIILKIIKTSKKFHARFNAKKRTYEYIIINRQSPLALQKNKAWHIRKKLNIDLMKKGAKSPIKTMEKISIKKNKDKITIRFISKSFLQQQVRSMVGCLKYLGDGHWNFKNFEKSFQAKKRFKCAPPAPACGLYLKKITY